MDVKRAATRDDGAGTVRDRLRAALPEAMKARDAVAVAALRSALGALDNAEAVDADLAPQSSVGHPRLAGTVSGLRAAEVERRSLSAAQPQRGGDGRACPSGGGRAARGRLRLRACRPLCTCRTAPKRGHRPELMSGRWRWAASLTMPAAMGVVGVARYLPHCRWGTAA